MREFIVGLRNTQPGRIDPQTGVVLDAFEMTPGAGVSRL